MAIKIFLLVALSAATVSARTLVPRHGPHPDQLVVMLENGTVIVDDLTLPFNDVKDFNPDDIGFTLYRSSSKTSGCKLTMHDKSGLNECNFDPEQLLIFLVHGYINSGTSDSVVIPKDAYVETTPYNVIIVDWEPYNFPYLLAFDNARSIGETIANLAMNLIDSTGLRPEDVHIIGHSMGAHIAGFAGKHMIESRGQAVGRITGLDPASPYFDCQVPNERLDRTDATVVDVIHTCIQFFGINCDIGLADFWPNGGSKQPDCESDLLGTCDHMKAYIYYTNSIRDRSMYGTKKCNSAAEAKKKQCTQDSPTLMGEDSVTSSEKSLVGNYYVEV